MVVDDEEFCQTAMSAILQKAGINVNMQVDNCLTGLEALTML